MKNLIKAEFYRLRKDKVALIGIIVAFGMMAFSILMNLILKGVFSAIEDDLGVSIMSGLFLFKSSFEPANNMGLIMLIFGAIILIRDFSQSTIRQKIIFGYTRKQIFFASVIVITAYVIGVMVLVSILSLILGSLLFGYSSVPFKPADIYYLLGVLGLYLLIYSVYLLITLFFGYLTKSIGATIGIVFGFTIVLLIFSGVFGMIANHYSWMKFFVKINPSYGPQVLLQTTSIKASDALYISLSSIVYITLTIFGGYLVFKKSDIK
ncbi:MAG: hypothetical protein GX149_01370 [Acholeplasmataceae bacterium]|nr:hypothetical protein [Acholeplasmataceae bacterium]